MRPSRLHLADGKRFSGQSPAWQTDDYHGEAVFNTGMTGYVESLTDPSYAGQILVFTYPLIGNYGVPDPETWESLKIHAAGVVVSQACEEWSHTLGRDSLAGWLRVQGVPLITGVDTRTLTRHLRSSGTMPGAISGRRSVTPKLLDPVRAGVGGPVTYAGSGTTVVLVDCGVKTNILRSLLDLGVTVKRVPADYDYTSEPFDGVLLSNGPGDPTDYAPTITITRKALKSGKPVFGICLGSQVMALAAGGKTYKLPFGHRGHNQPCQAGDDRCYITSQNHGYAINDKSLPKDWRVSFRNLNDNSVEGIEHSRLPYFAVQFHPEACPGPTDTAWLFEKFRKSL